MELSADLSGKVADLYLSPAVLNGAGIFSYLPELKTLSQSPCIGGVVLKSVTLKPRAGNETPVYVSGLNAMGLPNPGAEATREQMEKYYPLGVPLIVSVAGNTPEEFIKVIEMLDPYCDALELNYSCPNIGKGETGGIMIGVDPREVKRFTREIRAATKKPIIPKLSPAPYIYSRDGPFPKIVEAALEEGANAISAINTIPGGMEIDVHAEMPILSAEYGGVSGDRSVKRIGVGCVYTIHRYFPKADIIGGGGINLDRPESMLEYIEAGASAVFIATGFESIPFDEMDKRLEQFLMGVDSILCKKGVEKLSDLRGAAHRRNE